MRVIVDAHLHSKYSRATSIDMNLPNMARFARTKGINIVGTGDFTHPKWLKEIESDLVSDNDFGLYMLRKDNPSEFRFMLTAEVYTNFEYQGKNRRIHHVIWAPDTETVKAINDELAAYGSLEADGRPALNMSAPELVEIVTSISSRNFLFPAHAWTPWFSLYGSAGGFDSIKECYGDQVHKIQALETGLSSDPPMNWRLSELDNIAIISNSDSHSAWPWRLGREATILEIPRYNYDEIINAIKSRDPRKLVSTIETDPAYGKYHWTGHRNCRISMPAVEAMKIGNKCPVCGLKMTSGVEQRVEELADRPAGYKPSRAPEFVHILPLSEIIATVLGINNVSNQQVWAIFNKLLSRFSNEYNILLNVPYSSLVELVEPELAKVILQVRAGELSFEAGYDGVYGRLLLKQKQGSELMVKSKNRRSRLEDFSS